MATPLRFAVTKRYVMFAIYKKSAGGNTLMQKSPIVLMQLFMPLFNYMFLISAIIIIIALIKKYANIKTAHIMKSQNAVFFR